MDKKIKDFVVGGLRRLTYKWPPRWEAEKRSKLNSRGEYFCEDCGLVCKKKDTQMDHHIPVVDPIQGFINFDVYVTRLFCDADNWRRLCKPCHKDKTNKERKIRDQD